MANSKYTELRVILERVETDAAYTRRTLEKIEAALPSEAKQRLEAVEGAVRNHSRAFISISAVCSFILGLLPFSDSVAKFFHNLNGG